VNLIHWLCWIGVGIILFCILTVIIFLTIDDPKRRIDARED
jgi:hypothetical protein